MDDHQEPPSLYWGAGQGVDYNRWGKAQCIFVCTYLGLYVDYNLKDILRPAILSREGVLFWEVYVCDVYKLFTPGRFFIIILILFRRFLIYIFFELFALLE